MGNVVTAIISWRRDSFLLGLVGSLALASCGGSEKKSEPAPTPLVEMEEEEEYVDQEDEMISDDSFNEIKRTFERKSSTVARCYPDAVEAGEADKEGKIKLTVGMVIQKSGVPLELKVIGTTKRSAILETCVLEAIGRWQFSDLPQELPYTFTFMLQNL